MLTFVQGFVDKTEPEQINRGIMMKVRKSVCSFSSFLGDFFPSKRSDMLVSAGRSSNVTVSYQFTDQSP